MYGIAASGLYRNSRSERWPRHYQNQELYTFERHFIYEFAKTSLYEWQRHLGMLNPHAEVFYPSADNYTREKNIMEKSESIQKEDKAGDIKTEISLEDTVESESNCQNKNDEWKKVQSKEPTLITTDTVINLKPRDEQIGGYYDALKEREEEQEKTHNELKEERRNNDEKVHKEEEVVTLKNHTVNDVTRRMNEDRGEELKKDYNVNTMSIEEMEEVIEEIETSQNDEEDVGIHREEWENEIETVDKM